MTEEQEKYVTSLQCFGHFECDHVTCKVCGIAVECYDRTDDHFNEHPELDEYQPIEEEIQMVGG